jgi:hypothetical protein
MKKTCFCGISEHCGYQIETDMEQHDKVIFEDAYNKAIDDFVEKLDNHTFVEKIETNYSNSVSFMREIRKMAEQLKNERN